MATEWYVENDGRPVGPFSVTQMKAQAAANRIKPGTRVRKGQRGKWIEARRVQGLLAEDVLKQTETSATNHDAPPPQPAAPVDDEGTFLAPLRSRKRRAIVWGVLIAFILIGRAPLHQQLFFDLTMGLIIGSFPIIEVKKKTIEQTFFLLFYPVHKKTWRLSDFVSVEPEAEQRLTDEYGCLIIVFFWYVILFRFFDFLMPWLGGKYKIFLKEIDDERLQIWQGSSVADYEANLELFASKGLPIT